MSAARPTTTRRDEIAGFIRKSYEIARAFIDSERRGLLSPKARARHVAHLRDHVRALRAELLGNAHACTLCGSKKDGDL